jgi:putative PIN family toxin of toxin-antitoxin system
VSAGSAPDNDSVVIDTNVLVSALLTGGGLPEAVIDLAISGAVQWFASESVLAEYGVVLNLPRLAIAIDSRKAADAIARIRAIVSVGLTGSARRSGNRPRR